MHTAVVAPGGHGKSVILAEIREAYRQSGMLVVDCAEAVADLAGREQAALVVDDAHRLDEPQLRALHRLAVAGRIGMTVAYRPWPRPPALVELAEVLGRAAPPLMPAPLDRAQVAAFLAARSEHDPPAGLAEFVHDQTGGVPGFVDRLVSALLPPDGGPTIDGARPSNGGPAVHGARPSGGGPTVHGAQPVNGRPPDRGIQPPNGRPPAPGVRPFEVPAAAILPFRHDLEALDAAVLRYLLAVEAGAGLHIELLGGLLGRGSDAVAEVMAAARATGLLDHDGALLPITWLAIAALVPVSSRIAVRQRLAELQLDGGGPVLGLACGLLGTGVVGVSAAAVFHTAAVEAAPAQPELAAKLFEATVTAGSPLSAVAAGWADAAARSGDLDAALRLADQAIAAPEPADRATAACVAAAALAHRGQLARSAELHRWAGTPPALAFAAAELLATGRLTDAASLAASRPDDGGPPTMLGGAAALVAHGVRQSVDGSSTDALATLVRAATLLEPAGGSVLLPDTPAAVAATVALHCGELGIAESLLHRAIAAGLGGAPLATRHRLLLAWTHLVRGNLAAAHDTLAAVLASSVASPTGGPAGRAHVQDVTAGGQGHSAVAGRLEPRDALFAVALEVGLARRASDLPALGAAWGRACEAVVRHPVDLFTLPPLGELAMGAARLGEQARLEPHLAEARSLLAALADPPLWSMPLHWSLLHAAIIGERPDEAERHAAALAACGTPSGSAAGGAVRYGAVLSAAAECWLAVVAGRVDAEQVEAAARGLHAAGLCWDGARLAGQAAIRTSDRKAMVQLLDCARLLQGRSARQPRAATASSRLQGHTPAAAPDGPPNAAGPAAGTVDASTVGGALSERELEVADLVLAGHTYKQVGARLFISAKTVEHHMARIRRKLGCDTRSELLARLRQLV